MAILDQNNVEFDIVNYLENPASESDLRSVLQDLGIGARVLMRKGESVYKDLQLSNKSLTEDELIKVMLNHPILIERQIVRTTKGVVIGRPPENVQSIL